MHFSYFGSQAMATQSMLAAQIATPNTSSQLVYDVQQRLLKIGYLLTVNGAYDAATSAAVIDFRRKMGLSEIDVIDSSFTTTLAMVEKDGFEPGTTPGGDTGIKSTAMIVGGGLLLLVGAYFVFGD